MNTSKVKPINLFYWQKSKAYAYEARIKFTDMRSNGGYDPKENAQALARFLMNSIPGNTLDIVFKKIADDIRLQVKNNPALLLEDYDLENRIRCALNSFEHEL